MESLNFESLESLFNQYATEPPKRLISAVAQTGIMSLDLLLGGGLAAGLTEIYGGPSSGKTALVGHIIAHNQKRQVPVALIEGERMDVIHFRNLGVDLEHLALIGPDSVKEFLDKFKEAVVLVDSVTALASGKEDYPYDLLQSFKECLGPKQSIVCVSQTRSERSIQQGKKYNSKTMSASFRFTDIFVTRLSVSREAVSVPYYTQVIRVEAHPLSPPAQFVKLPAQMGFGIDLILDLLMVGLLTGVVQQKGHYYRMGEYDLGQGKAATVKYLRDNDPIVSEMVRQILSSQVN